MDAGRERTVLLRRQKPVKLSDQEVIFMLRAYLFNPSRWTDIINDIRANMEHLNADTQTLYRSKTIKQLRDRLSTKLSSLMAMPPDAIPNAEIRNLVQQVRNVETHFVDNRQADVGEGVNQPGPAAEADQQEDRESVAAEGPANQADPRDFTAAALSSSSSEEDVAPAPEPARRARRKCPLSEIVRDNHMLYARFMRKKCRK